MIAAPRSGMGWTYALTVIGGIVFDGAKLEDRGDIDRPDDRPPPGVRIRSAARRYGVAANRSTEGDRHG